MHRNRCAFTHVELLVVLAIMAVLVGLLLPAIQKLRAAASRMQCADNLRRMGVAFLAHHDAHGAYPQGGLNQPGLPAARLDVRQEWAWGYHILPYLGHDALFRSPSAETILASPLRLYHCPFRRAPILYGDRAMTDYAGCAGSDPVAGANGIVARADEPIIRMADVTDGVSNTVMVGEKQLNAALFGSTRDDSKGYAAPGWSGDFEAYRVGSVPPACDVRTTDEPDPRTRFGSAHRAGFNALFGDGAVRHLGYGVDATAWLRACVRNSGESAESD